MMVAAITMIGTQAVGQQTFDQGDKIVNLGVGVFGLGFNATAEYGIQKNLGVGAYFGYERISTGILGAIAGVNYGYNQFHVGARATYHLGELLKLDQSNIDLYAAGGLGVGIYRGTNTTLLLAVLTLLKVTCTLKFICGLVADTFSPKKWLAGQS